MVMINVHPCSITDTLLLVSRQSSEFSSSLIITAQSDIQYSEGHF